jgi:hypothetical protein
MKPKSPSLRRICDATFTLLQEIANSTAHQPKADDLRVDAEAAFFPHPNPFSGGMY